MLQIVAGSSSLLIAQNLAHLLNVPLIKSLKQNFADTELKVRLPDDIKDADIVIVQATSKPVNDNLMELLLTSNAAKHANAKQITAVIPYFGYARQDKAAPYAPTALELIADFFAVAGINRIITVDLHSPTVESFFKIETLNLSTAKVFAKVINKQDNLVIVAPDAGSKTRAEELSKLLNTEILTISKHRNAHSSCIMSVIAGNAQGKNCIIIDDIVDTGETLCKATELLFNQGALSVTAAVTHAVLSDNAIDRIEQSKITEIITTNSIAHEKLPNKFKILDISDILQKAIEITHIA